MRRYDEDDLREAVGRWRTRGVQESIELGPVTAHEAITRQMVEQLSKEVGGLRVQMNGLIAMVAGALVVQIVIQLAGMK